MAVESKKRRRRSGRPQKRGQERRQQLLSAALNLLGESGFQEITYQRIADEAGVPIASCYHFYRSKLDLVRALADELTDKYLDVVFDQPNYVNARTWQDYITTYVEQSVQHHNRSLAELQIFFSGDVPLTLRQDALKREKIIGLRLLDLLRSKFEVPEIADVENVFFRAVEIARTVLALDFQETDELTSTASKEAERAITGYLSNYLPPVLIVKATPAKS